MTETVALLTPTGDRPEAFALCERWMARQTRKPDLWICTDNGKVPTRFTMGQMVVRVDDPDPGIPGKGRKMLVKRLTSKLIDLGKVADILVMAEDDDWYAPNYIEEMARVLRLAPVASPRNVCLYYLNRGGFSVGESKYFLNYQLGLRGHVARDIIKLIEQAGPGDDPILPYWKKFGSPEPWRKLPRVAVGIKGMPGRGHASTKVLNEELKLDHLPLSCQIGDDAEHYRPYISCTSPS